MNLIAKQKLAKICRQLRSILGFSSCIILFLELLNWEILKYGVSN